MSQFSTMNADTGRDPEEKKRAVLGQLKKDKSVTLCEGNLVALAVQGQIRSKQQLIEWGNIYDFEWGCSDLNRALRYVAKCNLTRAMQLLKDWGANDLNGALESAAQCNQLDAMALAIDWGASDFTRALRVATEGGHLEAMRVLCEKGAELGWAYAYAIIK